MPGFVPGSILIPALLMPVPVRFTDEQMFDICEKLYELNGFVKWTDVGKALGVSRQAIQLRLRAAIRRGELTEADYERWASMSARAAVARENRARGRVVEKERRRLELKCVLSPENAEWLRTQCVFRKATSGDIINGLINKERAQG